MNPKPTSASGIDLGDEAKLYSSKDAQRFFDALREQVRERQVALHSIQGRLAVMECRRARAFGQAAEAAAFELEANEHLQEINRLMKPTTPGMGA